MVFIAPPWVPELPAVPDTVPIPEFLFEEKHGRAPLATSLDPYVDGLSGRRITPQEQKQRVTYLARSLAKELGWEVNQGAELSKVAAVFALNTIDVPTINWAIHRLNGVSSPVNAIYNATELAHQLVGAGAQALFTVLPLLEVALKGAKQAGIRRSKIFICEMPGDDPSTYPPDLKTVFQLVETGKSLPDLPPIKWESGQGAHQIAFLCYSSGTSGLPKGVMISHRNVIANVIQISTFESKMRHALGGSDHRDVALGLLPQSHIYGLVVISHVSMYRGDSVVILPRFDLTHYLSSIQNYAITTLYLVPPIIITMVKNQQLCSTYDLSSVKMIFTGAAPLGEETAKEMNKQYPSWALRQGYGTTETCTVVTSSIPDDLWFGSSGSILPGFVARIISPEGREIVGHDEPGELLVKSPSITLGYLNNETATRETYVELQDGRYMRTGDEVVVRKAPSGNEHFWIVDRIKELIKVKGHQVAPAELEACLLTHPAVADCAVIPISDDAAGEVPKAYVVKAVAASDSDPKLRRDIQEHVAKEKADYKRLRGGIEFIDIIPKSPSGKILRRLLRDRERARAQGQDPATAKL
ncbi:uncharacterized protein Z518_01788 [Rhinocladiella mackenziei CBS 650.93]|uniref:Rhinocladiella mackenziei CBS 650.93 unplaced genomic scaffold supercont1.1, whole genome shotgun sequence n=1 Tax=Rhinocladiella mackenziei CBS 650.93 TaxID=1442369 RepID=A0A0D2IXE4_9EURO|nr:uncharacterized protein Z518_01788 [Rhinocladiella mackenziei CBS 650.93]KIX10704.1 hypothetical protein Z518_01788 [Rhinocladiella mackenziei CBS 650.93]